MSANRIEQAITRTNAALDNITGDLNTQGAQLRELADQVRNEDHDADELATKLEAMADKAEATADIVAEAKLPDTSQPAPTAGGQTGGQVDTAPLPTPAVEPAPAPATGAEVGGTEIADE